MIVRCLVDRVDHVDLTRSYEEVWPEQVRARYEAVEVRNAAGIIATTNPAAWRDLIDVLDGFSLLTSDLVDPGGNESKLAARLNAAFRARGWREARVDTHITLRLVLRPYRPAGETAAVERETEVENKGFQVDCFRDRIALDVEWNAKDGNLDRDIAAYRALYDHGLIDAGIIVTRTTDDLRSLGERLRLEAGMDPEDARKVLATSTTTNLPKLLPKITRGDGGGCPILAIGICARTWEHAPGQRRVAVTPPVKDPLR